jgi:hypothetical protein
MFSNISWSAYLAFIILSVSLWYIFVLYVYYRHDLMRFVKRKQASPDLPSFVANVSTPFIDATASKQPPGYQPKLGALITQPFYDEIEAYLELAAQHEISKEILLESLREIATKYPSLQQSGARDQVELFIIKEIESNCAMFLRVEEIKTIWNRT